MASLRPTATIGYRAVLMLAMAFLVLATGALLVARSFWSAREQASRMAGEVFEEISHRAADETRAELGRVEPALELVKRLARQSGGVTPGQLIAVLRAHPDFTWVSFTTPDGGFNGALRLSNGTLEFHRTHLPTHLDDGRTVRETFSVEDDDRLTPKGVSPDSYDARTRPFFQLAVAEKRTVWTKPYLFFAQGVPGISCATPEYGTDGALTGVYFIGVDLNRFSESVRRLKPGPHGKVFLFTADGTLVAHPTVHIAEKSGTHGEGRLLTLAETDDVGRAFLAEASARGLLGSGAPPATAFELTAAGERYRARLEGLDVGAGLRVLVGAVGPESDYLEHVRRENAIGVGVSLAAVLVSLVLSFLLAGRLAGPLAAVAQELERLGRFDLHGERLPATRLTELAMVHRMLDAMRGGLRSFASYVPRDLVRAVLDSGEEARLGGHLRPLTVFFSDIEGFTTLSERVPPEELVAILGRYLEEIAQIIAACGGTVDKYMGDGVMAFWNAPADVPNHAAQACAAAVKVQRRLAQLHAQAASGSAPLRTRIGLSTGDAVVGNIGTRDRMNYTALGDTVNLAARLESLNKDYGTSILAAESTVVAAAGAVVVRPLELVVVAGKSKEIRVFEVVNMAADATETERAACLAATEGFTCYLERRFADAAEQYRRVLSFWPNDRHAAQMLARCSELEILPPPAEWSGKRVMGHK